MTKALALINGSLDSEVAATLVQRAGCDVTCAVFACPFQHRTGADAVATRLGSPLVTLEPDSTFLDVVRRPRFNFGGGPLSCLECRARMLAAAREEAMRLNADLIVTGEVLGQRATNQSRRQLDLLTYHSGASERLYRPLSAKLLGASPKIGGFESSSADQGISGSGRRPIRALAKNLAIDALDRPSPQCRLSDPGYMARLDDLVVNQAHVDFVDIELLLLGRHYRLNRDSKAIVGRNAEDNAAIVQWHARHERGKLFVPANFQGASVLLLGDEANELTAMSLSAGRKSITPEGGFRFHLGDQVVAIDPVQPIDDLKPILAE